jgi:hypothetical protein
MAVFPSPESETEMPCAGVRTAPVPTSFACWLQIPPERVNTHAAPVTALSLGPPTIAVSPSPESETENPCPTGEGPMAPEPISFACWLHTPPDRVNTHAAPASALSPDPPTMAVFPSAESETEIP